VIEVINYKVLLHIYVGWRKLESYVALQEAQPGPLVLLVAELLS
jgi:hypothetical protein